MKKALLDEILRRCQREMPKHPQFDNFLHWSFLIKNNQIVSKGVNRHLEPPKFYGYHGHGPKTDAGYKPKWHSELDCIRKARCYLVGCDIVNVRLNKSGEIRLSMPCSACRNLLYVVGINKCYFSFERGWGTFNI